MLDPINNRDDFGFMVKILAVCMSIGLPAFGMLFWLCFFA